MCELVALTYCKHSQKCSVSLIVSYPLPRRMRHPNIVLLMGYIATKTVMKIVMSFIDGPNLYDLVFRKVRTQYIHPSME